MFYCCHTEATHVKLLSVHPVHGIVIYPRVPQFSQQHCGIDLCVRELFLELLDRRCVLSLLQLIRGLVFGVGVQRNVWIPFEFFFSLIKSAICRPPSTSWLFRGGNRERPLSRPPSALSPCLMSSPPPATRSSCNCRI